MNQTIPMDSVTLQTAQRIARARDCSIEDVVRDAISRLESNPMKMVEPDSELVATIPMPVSSRAVSIRIISRSPLSPQPVPPVAEEHK